ncbi:MAG: hypothetical protein KDJ90_05085 [Nitratireductor sp.]|nr:hypothetical protein [Nitratireductor sp.]
MHSMVSPYRLLTASILLLALGGQALAARPDTRAMTCAQGRALLAGRGTLVMSTGPHTYERFVHNRGFCSLSQETSAQHAPTLDDPRCRIGYICVEATRLLK